MKIIVANWKMYIGIRESVALARAALLALRGRTVIPEVIVCPSFVALTEVRKTVARSHVALGAQDLFWEDTGAFTGEESARTLAEAGVTCVIVGHSERRRLFGETDEAVGKKVVAALAHALAPIICVGETAEEHTAGRTEEVVSRQLSAALKSVTLRDKDRLYVAYEPVWAIGTGTPATPADAVAVHRVLRQLLKTEGKAYATSILYGGSVDSTNAYGFLREPEIDGLLVGGASVKLQQFSDIVRAAGEAMEGAAAAGKEN